jgi:Ca2+-binding EF-hand superfamily protein
MPNTAAVFVASKKREEMRQKADEIRRQKLEKQALRLEGLIDSWFDKHDVNRNGKMDRDEIKALLTDVKRDATGDPAAEVKPELLDEIMTKFDLSADGEIERPELIPAVRRYKALLKHDAALRRLFAKHDTDKTGVLPPDQLLALLTEVAEDDELMSSHSVEYTEADVAFIMDRCDTNGDGVIDFSELGPAVAMWKEAVKNMDVGKKKCVIS